MQKALQIGNSVGVIIPQPIRGETGLNPGVPVEIKKQGKGIFILPKTTQKKKASGVNTRFAKMVDEFLTEHQDVLEELAKR
ncbi:MAG: hypothetical protein HY429_02885 [Candidatus Levybacteria bacterium]|nr:hypothetical protein [Candidatus Levybacteria bacterium]